MTNAVDSQAGKPQFRLLNAAFELFQNNEYNKVTTRQLAAKACSSVGMIKYCFGSKQGLYEEVIRQQFNRLQKALLSAYSKEQGLDFSQLFLNYAGFHKHNPDHCQFIMNILSHKNGPGYELLTTLLDRKWDLLKTLIGNSQKNNHIIKELDADVFCVALTSLSVFPFLIKEVLNQSDSINSENIFENLAVFSAALFKVNLNCKDDLKQSTMEAKIDKIEQFTF
ncbi:MAG: TetR/AcrR family transcriptional regulator [Bermanella sp.]